MALFPSAPRQTGEIQAKNFMTRFYRGPPPSPLVLGLPREYQCYQSGKKKEPKPKSFGPGMFGWGGGLPRGPKTSVCHSKPGTSKLFWRDIPGFCWDIPAVPEKFDKQKVCGSIFGPKSKRLPTEQKKHWGNYRVAPKQWHFYANKAKTAVRHFCLKRYKTRCTPVKRDRFPKSPRNSQHPERHQNELRSCII